MVDLTMLCSTIDGSGYKRDYVANRLGISRFALFKKLSGESEFTASELSKLKTVLGLNQGQFRRIFFASESELNSTRKEETN